MKQSKLTGGKRFQKWIEKGDLPNGGGILSTFTIRCITSRESQVLYIQESTMETIGGSHRLLRRNFAPPQNFTIESDARRHLQDIESSLL